MNFFQSIQFLNKAVSHSSIYKLIFALGILGIKIKTDGKRISILITIFLLSLSRQVSAQPLSGTYLIGPTGNYSNFSAAAADLDSSGISGPVIFEIETGTYTDLLDLSAIAGTDSTNTITFRSQSGNAADVVLQNNSTSLGSFVVQLDGADYIVLENLSFTTTVSLQAVIDINTG